MIQALVIFAVGVLCGIAASRLRLRLMKKKVRLYECYIQRRLEGTGPFDSEWLRLHGTEPPLGARGSLPEADQRR